MSIVSSKVEEIEATPSTDFHVGIETDSDLDSNLDFDLTLERGGEKGGFHIYNLPDAKYQRPNISEQRGPVDIRCKSREVIHGSWGDSSSFATLLVYDFHFNAQRFRRIASANITFDFSSSQSNAPPPEVAAISPHGRYALLESSQEESYTNTKEVKADGGQFGVNLGASSSWSKSVNRASTDNISLVGDTGWDMHGREISVNFTLIENSQVSKGIPSFLRVAILLRRKQNNHFQCNFKIKIEADWKTEIKKFFASKGTQDDPILFDLELPPTNKLRSDYDLENLGSIVIDDIFDTTFHKTFDRAIKSHSDGSA
ncbi:hypothetical protein HYFRA_00003712 [Hymenoscyphus fraxineus]|uniref:Uncharacterized protein n=1 Tax=Hymenoscyphus fraxineus TaxID=746836 RepID=A0A9N9PW84_9HELO|nr:hypothetical protein HYFRA_00003712 [Hymenoscyphus fraxineus]